MNKVKCVECGGNPFYLDHLGVEPNICGWCNGAMCPTHKVHTACASKLNAHNDKIELLKLVAQRDNLNEKIGALQKKEKKS